MSTLHIYSNRHIKDQVHNIDVGDIICLDNSFSKKRWSLYFKYNSIDEKALNITYIDTVGLKEINMQNTIIVGNPPYNDGSKGRAPIYDKFLEKLAKGQPKKVTFIIPTNWFSQPHNKLGKDVRKFLKDLGVYKIQVNPVDLFETATVSTCTVFCEKEYTGNIELIDLDSQSSYTIKDFNETILPIFDELSRELILRLKPNTPYTTYSGKNGNTNKFRVVTSYMCYNILKEHPLNELKVIEPNFEKQSGYRVFGEFETKQEADTALECFNSFWHSKLIQFILRRTRTSTTLDNPQLSFVPKVNSFDQKFNDNDLYSFFKLTAEEIKKVEEDAQRYN